MVPGLDPDAEARLQAAMDRRVTTQTFAALASRDFTILDGAEDAAAAIGIRCTGRPVSVVVTDPARPVGHVHVHAADEGTLLFLDNRTAEGHLHAAIRVLGRSCVLFFNEIGGAFVTLADVFLRSHRQYVYWGTGTSAVGMSVELEGEATGLVVGDDGLISSGVWVRNHDMHAINDLRTGERLNPRAVDTVIERHVWLGQDALLLSCRRVGAGAIVGARALVKQTVQPCTAVGGVPARLLRRGVSWGRNQAEGISPQERASLAGLYQL